jgi:hypothetical protein
MQTQSCGFDSSWVLRIELDRYKMLERGIRMWEIQRKLEETFEDEVYCVFATDNSGELVIRLRIANDVRHGGGAATAPDPLPADEQSPSGSVSGQEGGTRASSEIEGDDHDVIFLLKHLETKIMEKLVRNSAALVTS